VAQRSQPAINVKSFWFGVAAPAVVWALHLVTIYAIQSTACHWGFLQATILGISGLRVLLLALTIAAGAVVILGGLTLNGIYQDLSRRNTVEREDPSGRVRFMARAGTWLAGLFLFALVMSLAPILFLDVCSPYWW
jgi:hypothetical protein